LNSGIYFSGTCSEIHAWTFPASSFLFDTRSQALGEVYYYGGDSSYTVGSPATAANVVSVGAYGTRNSWTDIYGYNQEDRDIFVNDIAYFSSRGPALRSAQGFKPNITAPGAYLISAFSIDYYSYSMFIIDWYHVVMQGTSMASPHVAGIVALMMQAYPSLTYDQIMNYLQSTARADAYVGSVPNANWGYGKVDAYAAVSAVLADYPPGADDGDYSGISITGVIDGATDIPDTTQSFTVNFPRPTDSSTCTTSNVFVVPTNAAASIASNAVSKSAWNAAVCNSSAALAAYLTNVDTSTKTLELNSQLDVGTFALFVSPNVRDSESIKFGGKTLTFTTASSGGGGDGGGSGGGCHIAYYSKTSSGGFILCTIIVSIVLLTGKRRRIFHK